MHEQEAAPAGEALAEWEALTDQQHVSPFRRPGWICAWWRAFGLGRLELVRCTRAGRPAAMLPIVRRPGVILSPTNFHTPAYGTVAADAQVRRAVLDVLFQSGARYLSLGFLPSSGDDLAVLSASATSAGYRVLTRTLERALVVRTDAGWDAYERSLSRNLRRDMGRCRRRAGEAGRLWLDVREDAGGLREALAIEARGWKGRAGTAILSRPSTFAFYSELASWAEARGWLRLMFLRLDRDAVAFHLALEQGGTYYPLKGGFEPAFGWASPGKLMLYATIERAFELGLERYELLGGADAYKVRWATDAYDRVLFQAFAPGMEGAVAQAAVRGNQEARRIVRRGLRAWRRSRWASGGRRRLVAASSSRRASLPHL